MVCMLHLLTYATDTTKMSYLNCPTIHNLCTTSVWGNFKDKLIAMIRYLSTKSPNDIICFVDAYDVICFADPAEIQEKFLACATDILVSAETSCYPWHAVKSMYPPATTSYRFLNSGSYIGYVWALQKMLSLDMSQSPCDQGYMTYYYINHIHDTKKTFRINLDHHCVLFQTAYGIPWSHFVIEHGRLHNVIMGTRPCFIHYNGNQHVQANGQSIMPIVYDWIHDGMTHVFDNYQKKHAAIGKSMRNHDIIALATNVASRFRIPDQATILKRDGVNFHAIIQSGRFMKHLSQIDPAYHDFTKTNRGIIEQYVTQIATPNSLRLDISLHDYVGVQMNTDAWPHSILGFSTRTDDTHNVLIPDLYAMQNYKGALDIVDMIPTMQKKNKLFFIGVSSGKNSLEENQRIIACRYAQGKSWIEAYLSGIVNLTDVTGLDAYMHASMTIEEQHAYRHIMVIDGNTSCWDRLPWVLQSNCVCWKLESADQCWYYPFLQPWVHYVPFTFETLERTWNTVKNNQTLQRDMVKAANQFVEDFLRPESHALYLRTLLNEIQIQHGDK